MAPRSQIRAPAVIIPPPVPSNHPATLIFLHDYNNFASRFNKKPPNQVNVAYHIHKSPSLQHVKIIIPEALPSRHPSITRNVWYDIPKPMPEPGDPKKAQWFVEFGHHDNNAQDMETTIDYFESLIKSEIASGTPASRIVLMGYSQGASVLVLFLLTRRLAADLGAVISYAGFPALDLQSVLRMQRKHNLEGRWSKETNLHMMLGKNDVFITVEIAQAWRDQLRGFRDRGQGIAELELKIIDEQEHTMSDRVWPYVKEILKKTVQAGGKDPSPKL